MRGREQARLARNASKQARDLMEGATLLIEYHGKIPEVTQDRLHRGFYLIPPMLSTERALALIDCVVVHPGRKGNRASRAIPPRGLAIRGAVVEIGEAGTIRGFLAAGKEQSGRFPTNANFRFRFHIPTLFEFPHSPVKVRFHIVREGIPQSRDRAKVVYIGDKVRGVKHSRTPWIKGAKCSQLSIRYQKQRDNASKKCTHTEKVKKVKKMLDFLRKWVFGFLIPYKV